MDIDNMRVEDVVVLFSGMPSYESGMAVLRAKAEAKYGLETCRKGSEARGLFLSDEGCLTWAAFEEIRKEAASKKLN